MVHELGFHCDTYSSLRVSAGCSEEDRTVEAVFIHRDIRDSLLPDLPAGSLLLRDGRKGVAGVADHVSLPARLAQIFVGHSQRAAFAYFPGQLLPHLQGHEEQQRPPDHQRSPDRTRQLRLCLPSCEHLHVHALWFLIKGELPPRH